MFGGLGRENRIQSGLWSLGPAEFPHTTVQFSSVAQLCPTVCNPMDCSTPGLSVHHQLWSLLKLMSIESVMPSNISSCVVPFSSCLRSFSASGSLQMSQFFASDGPSIGASDSVLPMNIQDWFPLGLTGWISLLSKGLSRVFSNTTVQKHPFFGAQLFYSPTFTSILAWLREKP